MLNFKILEKIKILCLLLASQIAISQNNINSIIDDKVTKINEIRTDSTIIVDGAIKGGVRTIYDPEGNNQVVTNFSAQLKIKYKGFTIPLQYNFSNGRSIANIAGPNIKLPGFSNLGFSPTNGVTTIHIGNRSLDFSKYTYQGLRFTGIGLEHIPESYFIKAFRGKIQYTDPLENNFANNLNPPFERNAYGINLEKKINTLNIGFVVFHAEDDYSARLIETQTAPKENTAIETYAILKLSEKLNVKYQTAVSAMSHDTQESKIDIGTHSTVYNMLGLFTKRTKSEYNYVKDLSFQYQLSEHEVSLNLVDIDSGYSSLGSLLFDNNYRSINMQVTGKLSRDIQYTSLFGLRSTKESRPTLPVRRQLQFNQSANWTVNEKLSLRGSYSNINNTQRVYQRRNLSSEIDSVFNAQISSSATLSANYKINNDGSTSINTNISLRQGTGIQRDSLVANNTIKNYQWNSNFITSIKNHDIILSSIFILNKSNLSNNTSIFNITDNWLINEFHTLNSTLTFNRLSSPITNDIYQISLNGIYEWNIFKTLNIGSFYEFNFGNDKTLYSLNQISWGIEGSWKFHSK